MPFPFIAPLKDWIVDKLKERESNPQKTTLLSPFAMMTSGAVVLKDKKTPEEIGKLFETQQYGTDAYYGCIITNTTDIKKLYQTGKTIVGYDLNGREIVVDGEVNRRVSVPIIESIEIDTDGGNNTLKTAQVKVKVFTLKQLEMFELFFLRPSMNVVLEYGWNTDVRNKSKQVTIDSKLFAKKTWDDYKKDYVALFTDKSKTSEYVQTLKDTEGEYDFMVGKVSNFSYSIEEDGTYSLNIEVSAGNELQLWPAYKAAKKSTIINLKDKTKIESYESFIKKIAGNFSQIDPVKLFDKKNWENEFFNYGITNDIQKNTKVSKVPYISFKVIIKILNNLKSLNPSGDGIRITYKYKGEDLIPVTSNPYIMSTNPDVLIPGKLPKIGVVASKTENIIAISTNDKDREDCLIKGKEFNLTTTPIFDFEKFEPIKNPAKIQIESLTAGKQIDCIPNTGNLLNIFFSYERFLEICDVADSLTDILTPILQTINNTMLGLCQLEVQKVSDGPSVGSIEIIDSKIPKLLPPPEQKDNSKTNTKAELYKFKMGAKNSIIKNLTFNMEMSTLMQAQALYSTQLAIAKRNKKVAGDATKEIDKYVSADLSYATNADGYFSINDMEVSIIKKLPNNVQPPTPEELSKQKEALQETIKTKFVRFKFPNGEKNVVYEDQGLIQQYMLPKSTNGSFALTYLDISLEIDGMAGFSCGEYFNIEGIPEIYNKNGYFQILNVKQGIDANGWKTTIDAAFLLKSE